RRRPRPGRRRAALRRRQRRRDRGHHAREAASGRRDPRRLARPRRVARPSRGRPRAVDGRGRSRRRRRGPRDVPPPPRAAAPRGGAALLLHPRLGQGRPMTDSDLLAPDQVARGRELLLALRDGMARVVLGQDELCDLTTIALAARGHLLLEGLPGLGKTELVKTLATLLGLSFRRVQFTPDLLPSDVTGGPVLQQRDGERRLEFQPGPLFAHCVLADEINRASPKTQSALLEAMQEHRVTVLGVSHPLPEPFFVLATQNPIELEGTYPLPEAQLDRFLLKVEVPS